MEYNYLQTIRLAFFGLVYDSAVVFSLFVAFLCEQSRINAEDLLSTFNRYATSAARSAVRKQSLVLFQGAAETLVSFKATQWNITYYCLALFGAYVAALIILKDQSLICGWEKYIFSFLAILTAEISLYLVLKLQLDIRYERISLNYNARIAFGRESPGFRYLTDKELQKESRVFRDIAFPGLFIASILVGLSVVVYMHFRIG